MANQESSAKPGWKSFFESSVARAKTLDIPGLYELSQKSLDKLSTHKSKLDSIGNDAKDIAELISCWARGVYTRVPWSTIVTAAAALLYFLNPLDFVPDFILGVGLLDDFTVIAFVVKAISSDLEKFREWKSNYE